MVYAIVPNRDTAKKRIRRSSKAPLNVFPFAELEGKAKGTVCDRPQ